MALSVDWSNPSQRARFGKACEWSYRKLESFRDHRYEVARQYVGRNYGEEGDAAKEKVPVNLIELAVNVFSRFLSAHNPRVLYRTAVRDFKAASIEHEVAINSKIKRIRFSETMREITSDALLGVGIGKVGSAASAEVKIDGQMYGYGQPYFDRVDLDDFVFDMASRTWHHIGYAGNFSRHPVDLIRNNESYERSVREVVEPANWSVMGDGPDKNMASLSRGQHGPDEDALDYCGIWEFFHPISQQFTVHVAGPDGMPDTSMKPLLVADWSGPPHGPYHLLKFNDVANNIMPLSPAASWIDLHDLVNRLMRKLGKQAERQKTILGVQSSGVDDGERIINANDGDTIRLDNPGSAQEYKFGGIDPQSLAFTIHLKDLFTYLSGNLDALGGLGPQSDTLGQDRLLVGNASRRVTDMQARVVEFTRLVVEDLDSYLWEDPLDRMVLTKKIGRNGLAIPFVYSANSRRGQKTDYEIIIEPYSQQDYSPSARSAMLLQFWREVLLPAAPMMAQQGMAVDYQGLIRAIAHYNNLTELEDIVTFSDQIDQQSESMGGSTKPASTERTYTRRNIPGASVGGKDAAMIQALLGAGEKNGVASTLRPTG